MTLTFADWIAIATIALPLIANACGDWVARGKQAHNLALDRIVGMAGRQAATIARTLQALPAGIDPKGTELLLIDAATKGLVDEMHGSIAATGGTAEKVSTIVQGELDKVLTAKPASGAA